MSKQTQSALQPVLAVIWIDWYAYHIARFEGLASSPKLMNRVVGIELVGGVGVHQGLKFSEDRPSNLPIETLLPECSWKQAGQLRLAILLWRRLSNLNPAAVLVPGYYTLPAIAAALWARAHNRLSILMTESTASDHPRVVWKEIIKAVLLRCLFNAAVVGGKAHARYLKKLGFPQRSVAHYYDVVDNSKLAIKTDELRNENPYDFGLPGSPYFLYVGRMAAEKNVDGLITAWTEYRDAGGTWPLVLVGDGPLIDVLRSRASKLTCAGEIYFAGMRTSQELFPYYTFAGCFVLPSMREPWGLVVNEAMASGLPVLVSNRCGSAEDLVDEGQNGFSFDPLSQKFSELLRHIGSLSIAELQIMGNHSRQLIAAYSPQNFGREVESLINMGGI